jgi:hypothetical protein
MKSILWLGLLLTSSSWLYFIPIFNSPDEKIGILLLILGTICNIIGFWKSKTIYFKERYLILFIPLILSIYIVPYPFNIGIILFTIGFAFSALFRRISLDEKFNMIFKGISLTGFILIVHAAFFPLYQIFVSHGHRADIFSPIISHLGNLLGLKTSVNNGIVFVQTTLETYPFIITWEKLGFFIWFNIFIGALVLFILFHRKRKILFNILIFLVISALYLIFRCIIFIHFYINTLELNAFWNPWYTLLSFLPLALLLMKILQLKNEDNRKKTILVLKLSKNNIIAMLLIFVFIFSIIGTFAFQDPGNNKNGRVLIDELHSDWEDSTRPLDKEWYGVLSTYNYYSWVEWLNYYYKINRNVNNTLTIGLLDNYDILILKCPTNPYSDEEINAIIQFVEQGGGLFLIGDHTNVFGMNTYLNTVANKFGISFKTDATYELGTGALSSYIPGDIFTHPIVYNLEQFDFMTSCTLDAPFFSENVILGNKLINEPGTYSTENFFSESIATTESEFGYFLQSVAVKHGKGRVVAFTDSTVFSSFSVFTDGYQTYSLGVFNYLNRENVYSYINTLFLGIGIVFLILLIYSIRKEHKLKIASLFLFIGLLSFSVATPIFLYVNTVNYQLPTAHTDFTQVCFVQEHSNIKISLEPSILIEKEKNEFGTFYVWTQRIGCIPSVETTLDEAVQKADIIVFINPIKTFSNNDIDLISKFIENGGKMLVMDSITNSLSTSNELISNFGMWINKKSDNLQLFDNISEIDENNSKGIIMSPYLSISGGEKTIFDERNETQIGVMNFYNEQTGKNGTIVVVVDSYTFRDQNMGGVFIEPNDEQLKIYDTEFLIFEEFLKISK